MTVIHRMRMGALAIAAVGLIGTSFAQVRPSHNLMDARSAIRQIRANDPESKIEAAEKALAEHLRTFADHISDTSSTKATEWLSLLDEAIALPHRSFFGAMGGVPPQPVGTLYNVLITLPPPETWPEIRAIVDKRPTSLDRTALLILCARLNGDDEEILRLCDEYDRQSLQARVETHGVSETNSVRLSTLRRLGRLNDPNVIEAALRDLPTSQEFPNLADFLSPREAKELILRLMRGSGNVSMGRNSETLKLARRVVLDHLKELPNAHWELVESVDDVDFVNRLVGRYGLTSLVDPNNQAQMAQQVYLRDLAFRGRLDEAVELLKVCQSPPRLTVEDWGPAKDTDLFVAKLQTRLSHTDLWDLYVTAAIASGHSAEATKRLQALARDPKTPHERKLTTLGLLFDLDVRRGDLRALDRDSESIKGLRRLPADSDPAYSLLGIALASGDVGLIQKGITHELPPSYLGPDSPLFQALAAQGRLVQLERMELGLIEKSCTNIQAPAADPLTLCEIYFRADRPKDILALIQRFPDWPQDDLAKVDRLSGSNFRGVNNDQDRTAAFYAAWSLSKTGQSERAIGILRNSLIVDCQKAHCYELLNQIGGVHALPIYDEILRAHRLAPMPILWKGDLQLRCGRVAEAEGCAREAARIDPSGSYAYREKLADLQSQIFKKLGDSEGARSYAARVSAIRLASKGADLEQVGLLPQARQYLEKSLAIWPNDALVEGKLALVLERQCLPTLAKAHYRKAFKLLPACLGESPGISPDLWNLLNNTKIIIIELEILNAAVMSNPEDAKAYYARGLVHSNAGQSKEAVADLLRAVALDPNLVGAWTALSTLARQGMMSPKVAQSIDLKLIEMNADTDSRWESTIDLTNVREVRTAYMALNKRLRSLPTLDIGFMVQLHSSKPSVQTDIIPVFDRFSKVRRLPGWYLQMAVDIRSIAYLYHPTTFPFE